MLNVVKTGFMLLVLVSISACQQMSRLEMPDFLKAQKPLIQPITNQQSYAKCLANSSYKHPNISGQLIETPSYILITLVNQKNPIKSRGELCIIHKASASVEITAVNELRFLNK